jgi:hypothetical protein
MKHVGIDYDISIQTLQEIDSDLKEMKHVAKSYAYEPALRQELKEFLLRVQERVNITSAQRVEFDERFQRTKWSLGDDRMLSPNAFLTMFVDFRSKWSAAITRARARRKDERMKVAKAERAAFLRQRARERSTKSSSSLPRETPNSSVKKEEICVVPTTGLKTGSSTMQEHQAQESNRLVRPEVRQDSANETKNESEISPPVTEREPVSLKRELEKGADTRVNSLACGRPDQAMSYNKSTEAQSPLGLSGSVILPPNVSSNVTYLPRAQNSMNVVQEYQSPGLDSSLDSGLNSSVQTEKEENSASFSIGGFTYGVNMLCVPVFLLQSLVI